MTTSIGRRERNISSEISTHFIKDLNYSPEFRGGKMGRL
jgi:hypothetical protein